MFELATLVISFYLILCQVWIASTFIRPQPLKPQINPWNPHDALKPHFASLKTNLISWNLVVLERIFSWKCFKNDSIFFHLSPTLSHFHQLQVENCRLQRVKKVKFSPTWSCVSLPRPTTSSGWKWRIYLFNLWPNICKSWCLNTHFVPTCITAIAIWLVNTTH